jgi:hypothetical protein
LLETYLKQIRKKITMEIIVFVNIEYCEHHIIISAYMFTFPIKNFQPKMKKERVILPLFEESFMYFFFLKHVKSAN